MTPATALLIVIALSYLIGSIPSGVIISRLLFGFDIRDKGSGNMGSTNVFRVLGAKWGIVVQLLDILKGVIAVAIISRIFSGEMPFDNRTPFEDATVIKLIAGAAAVIGHIWSVFVRFRGGKGINTAAGMLVAIAPLDVGVALGFFLLTFFLSGYVSLGSMMAAITLPSFMCFRYNILHDNIPGYHTIIFFTIGVSLLVIYTHRSNISRLAHGTENRFTKYWLFRNHRK
ncbi:glycerol-3-phosphate 1-O-acyltransferase PlsY [Ignavibacteria bacterium]|nr:glycerol-3-phosphate 1-O-acyltransferase PlsY [Bacteroidota bacterium]MCZ2133386.1 glycerol-3-phosphate 1-O-acyltransferase PlsY [Bacteroidota bacterium]